MKKYINGEEAFKAMTGAVMVSQTSAGYVLNYSTDGDNWTPYKIDDEEVTIPANEDLWLVDVPVGASFKLEGNTDDNVLIVL